MNFVSRVKRIKINYSHRFYVLGQKQHHLICIRHLSTFLVKIIFGISVKIHVYFLTVSYENVQIAHASFFGLTLESKCKSLHDYDNHFWYSLPYCLVHILTFPVLKLTTVEFLVVVLSLTVIERAQEYKLFSSSSSSCPFLLGGELGC